GPDWQVEPSESTVSTPCTAAVPTVSCDPPLTDNDVQPRGSSSHNAGVSCGPTAQGRAVAERLPDSREAPRTAAKNDFFVDPMITRIRWHSVPSSSLAPPTTRESAISELG